MDRIDQDHVVVGYDGRNRTVRDILAEVDGDPDCQLRCEGCGQRNAFILCRQCAAAACAQGYRPDRRRNRRPIEQDVYGPEEGRDIMESD